MTAARRCDRGLQLRPHRRVRNLQPWVGTETSDRSSALNPNSGGSTMVGLVSQGSCDHSDQDTAGRWRAP